MKQEKIKALLQRMTLEEKVALIHGNGLFRTEGVKKYNILPLKMSDGPMGVRNEFPDASWVPLGYTDDYVTYFPSNMALASTWNLELSHTFGQALGNEARGRGKDVILGPGINIIRSPLCGRNFEYMSEDPYLISQLVVPFIQGVQENDVAACVKHFAVNNQETDRLKVSVEVDDRALHEIYLPGFKAAISKGNAYTIMGAYNQLRGNFCCQSHFLLREILRDQWHYEGVVISDWGAVHDTEGAALNGLDIEMNVTTDFDHYFMAQPLIEQVKTGHIEESIIDEKVFRILNLMNKLKLFSSDRHPGHYNTPEHRQLTLDIAREAIVLLKNENKFLPLDRRNCNKIAVIGENANRIHSNGGGSAEIKALYEITPLLGLKMFLGGNTEVAYSPGYSSDATLDETARIKLHQEAVDVAKRHDVVLFFSGLNHDFDAEGIDKIDLSLPYGQDTLIEDLLKTNPNTVIVNISGTPVDFEAWIEKAHSVVQSWYCGMEGGYALAEMLFGTINPSGKLPLTFPKKLTDSPAHSMGEFPGSDKVVYKESIFVGYRYFDTYQIEPRFSFGHGLSYSSFDYNNIEVIEQSGPYNYLVRFSITNTSHRPGCETAQLYISDLESALPRPQKELKGFVKVDLKPLETKVIEMSLDHESFSYYHDKKGAWICEPGEFTVLIGSSSKDMRLQKTLRLL